MINKTTKSTEPEIIPCKYAGDPNDEFCARCNGVEVVEGESKYAATQCGGYEANEVVDNTPPFDTTPEEVKPVINTAPAPVEEMPAVANDVVASAAGPEVTTNYTRLGIITSIRAESGATIELKGRDGLSRWYKFSYAEERMIPEEADLESEKVLLWNDVNEEVDQQVAEVKAFMQKS